MPVIVLKYLEEIEPFPKCISNEDLSSGGTLAYLTFSLISANEISPTLTIQGNGQMP